MPFSKQFTPKQSLKSKHIDVKIWGNNSQRKALDSNWTNSESSRNGHKSYTSKRSVATKIFAPKLTVLNNNVFVGEKPEASLEPETGAVSQPSESKDEQEQYTPSPKLNNFEPSHDINQDSNGSIVSGFWKAILPNISFGNSKKSISSPTVNNVEIKKAVDSGDRYNPETIFQKIQKTKAKTAQANQSSSLKNKISKMASRGWDSIKFDYYDKAWFRKLNYQFIALDIAKNFNRLAVCVIAFGLIGFFSYLSIFDQFFTIKKYTIEYPINSYLNKQQTSDLVSHFQKNKLFRVFPNNQYWFANDLSLTASAKEIFPDIDSINVKGRQWPDQITLQVETNKPILTLWVNENNQLKYWRVNQNGKILSQDKAAIWYNLVKIEKPYNIQNSSTEQLSLFNHSFESDPIQKKRFVTTKALLDYFQAIGIEITKTNFPSISDSDIIMESSLGSKFLFDSSLFDTASQIQRLDYFLKSKVDKTDYYALHAKGDFAYFDFRVAQKIHICKIDAKCNAKPE